VALWIVAVGSIFTIGQRMAHVARRARQERASERGVDRVGFRGGWRMVRAMPQPMAAAIFRVRPTAQRAAKGPECNACNAI
jgi:hypothetical protein